MRTVFRRDPERRRLAELSRRSQRLEAKLRQEIVAEFADLKDAAAEGVLAPEDLQTAIDSIFQRSRENALTPELRASKEAVLQEYSRLGSPKQRAEAIEELRRLLRL
jgi:hypothetical protein